MSAPHKDEQPAGFPCWYCLRTQSKREHIAAAVLEQIEGVTVFCPRISQIRKTRAGKKRFTEALFPSYLFARFSYQKHLRQVIHTQGIRGIVEQGQRRVVPDQIIEEIKRALPNGLIDAPDPSIQPGAAIEFIAGSLKGLNGTVIARLSAPERVKILLKFLGQEIELEARAEDIMLDQNI